MKKFLFYSSCFLAALLLLVASFPFVLSTTAGKNLLLSIVNSNLQGSLSIEELSLQWLGKQSIKGISLKDAQGKQALSLGEIDADASLLSFLFRSGLTEPFHIRNLEAMIAHDAQGVTNFEAIFGLKSSQSSTFTGAEVVLSHVNADLVQTEEGRWSLKSAGVTKQNDLKGQFNLSASYGEEYNLRLRAENFPLLFLDQWVAIKNGKTSGALTTLLGDSLDLTLDVAMKNLSPSFSLQAKSNTMALKSEGKVEKGVLNIDPSTELAFSVPVDRLHALLGEEAAILSSELKGNLQIKGLAYDLVKEKIDSLDLYLNVDRLNFDKMQLGLDKLNAQIHVQNAKGALSVDSSGLFNKDPFSLNFQGGFSPDLLVRKGVFAQLEEGIPFTASFDGVAKLNMEGTIAQKKSEIALSLAYGNIELNKLAVHLEALPLTVHSPVKLAFKGSGVSHEKEKVKGSLYVASIGKKEFDLDLSMENFNPRILQSIAPEHPIEEYTGTSVHAKINASGLANGNIEGNFLVSSGKDGEGFLKKLEAKVTLEPDMDIVFDLSIQQKIGSLHLEGSVQELFDKEKKLAFDQAEIHLKGDLNHFPIALISKVALGDAALSQKLEAVLGSQVDGSIAAKLSDGQGPIKAFVKGVNGQASIDGSLAKGVLYLNEPLTASLKITPQLERSVLRDFIPFLSYVAFAEKPIELTISKEGFQFPLRSPTLYTVQAPQVSLQLHKMQFNREGHLGKVAQILGINSSVFEVQFTPVYFSLQNGVVTVQRTDMLIAGSYPLASWGQVDFNKDALRFIVGLTPAALQNAFRVRTSSSYMLQIPVRGPISKPEIDTAKVTARISALIAQNQGPQGYVIGTVLDAASGSFAEDPPPSPTTNPLPWVTSASGKGEESLPEKIVEEPAKLIEQPVKELQKGAKKLLKGLFG